MNNKFPINVKDLKQTMSIEFRAEEIKAEIPVNFDIVLKKTLSYMPKKKNKGKK